MRYSISDTAEYGDYTAGSRIVTAETKATMRQILKEIQSGEFAKKWIAENESGLPELQADARAGSQSPDRGRRREAAQHDAVPRSRAAAAAGDGLVSTGTEVAKHAGRVLTDSPASFGDRPADTIHVYEQILLARHPAPQPGRVAGDAVRHRPDRRRPAEAAGRHLQHVVRGQHLQHAPRSAGRARQGRRAGGRPGRPALQHHRRQRRPLDGHRRHELLAAVARPDRRLDRDRDGRAVVRRADHRPRLRQEHAGQRHRDGAAQPAVADGLRRHDPRRATRSASRATSSRRSSRTASTSPATITDEQRLDIVRHSCPGAGACGGMYTANTMAVAIEALGLSLPYSSSLPAEDPGKADECRRAGAAVRAAARARPQAARHPDARSRSRTR